MPGNLTAGEPLTPPPDPRPSRPRAEAGPRVRRRRGFFGYVGMFVGAVLGLFVLAGIGVAVAGLFAYQHFAADLPNVDGLRHYQPRVMSRVYAGNSQLLAELATERRIFVPYTAIPDLVKRAFVSAEDQNFFQHRGIDPVAILRAAVTDFHQLGQGRRPIGASTITQQVAKNMLLGNEVSLSRKAREALLAIRIEGALSKERILELYLNEIYLGGGAYGVAAAAQTYFNQSLDELTPAEAAFLAALPKAPNNYNPQRFPDAARARRDWVLDRMMEDHVLTAEQVQTAKAQAVLTSPFRRPEIVAGGEYFAEDVRRAMVDRFGPDMTTQGGLTIRTSLDPALQAIADKALRDGLTSFDRGHGGWRGPASHLDGAPAALRADWMRVLPQVQRPGGMLAEWKLAVVLELSENEAQLGWLDRTGVPPGAPVSAGLARVSPMLLSDQRWARPVRNGHVGGTPGRMRDIVQIGDVVMVDVNGTPGAVPMPGQRGAPRSSERLMLRQIPQVEGALVSLDPRTGRVLALSGGWSYEMSQFDRATQAQRQPGSSFKPFVYLTAMQQGFSPNSIFLDAPFVMDMGAAGVWRPQNAENEFFGNVALHTALEKSLNLVTVRVAQRVGMPAVAQNAIAFHVVDAMPKVLPAALGAVETTVMRMAGAYASLDQGGREVLPTLIDSVQDRDGHVIYRAGGLDCAGCVDATRQPGLSDSRKQIADPQSAFQVVTMMQGVTTRGTGTTAVVGLNRPVAGKTGTTQDFNDAWFGGFTPDLVTIVWIGYDTPTSLGDGSYGAAVAAPIWRDFMLQALKNHPVLAFVPPPDIVMSSASGIPEAFKTGQDQGGGGGGGSGGDTDSGGSSASASSLDSGMGGLY